MRKHLVAGAVLACTLAAPRPAQASNGVEIAAVVVTLVVADLVFVGGDTVYAAQAERPDKTWATTSAIVGAPQTLILSIGTPLIAANVNEPYGAPLAATLSTIPAFVTIYGAWGASSSTVDPGALYGVSWATAANGMFTLAALGHATQGRLGGRAFGIMEVIATTPQLAVASAQLAQPNLGSKAGWIGLEAWAGALFVHGVAAIVVGGNDDGPPPLPPPEPPRNPPPPPPDMPPGPFVPDDPPKHGPIESMRIAPMPVPGGFVIGAFGTLF